MFHRYFGWVKFVPLSVGLMTGIVGGIREAVITFADHPEPMWQRKLFWACVWISCYAALVVAWVLKQRELIREQAKSEFASFDGEILDFELWPKLEETIGPKADFEIGQELGILTRLRIGFVNNGAASTISNFSFVLHGRSKSYIANWAEEYQLQRVNFSPSGRDIKTESVENLNDITNGSRLFTRGEHGEGFLEFVTYGITMKDLGDDYGLEVFITDAWNKSHSISRLGATPRPSRRINLPREKGGDECP
jgi:hypothetical protein